MIKELILGIGLIVVSVEFGAWIVFAMDLLSDDLTQKRYVEEI